MDICYNIDTFWFPSTRKLEPTQPWRQPSIVSDDRPQYPLGLACVEGSTYVRAIGRTKTSAGEDLCTCVDAMRRLRAICVVPYVVMNLLIVLVPELLYV